MIPKQEALKGREFKKDEQVKIVECLCPQTQAKGNDHKGMTGFIYGKQGNNYMVVSYAIYSGGDTYCYNASKVEEMEAPTKQEVGKKYLVVLCSKCGNIIEDYRKKIGIATIKPTLGICAYPVYKVVKENQKKYVICEHCKPVHDESFIERTLAEFDKRFSKHLVYDYPYSIGKEAKIDVKDFIRSLLRSKDQEADKRIEEAYKKGFNLVLKHMVKHTGEEDGVLYLTKIDWEICRRILKKLLRQEIKQLSSKK